MMPTMKPETIEPRMELNPPITTTANTTEMMLDPIIERTRLGAHLRAATENPALVQAFGINVPRLVTLTYGFGVGLAGLAGVDGARLEELLREVDTGSEALRDVLDRLAQDAGIVPAAEELNQPVPNLETKFAIVVRCESEEQQLELLEQFEQQELECRALVT